MGEATHPPARLALRHIRLAARREPWLAGFWAIILLAAAGTIGTLQYLGPPAPAKPARVIPPVKIIAAMPEPKPALPQAALAPAPPPSPWAVLPIALPLPSLLAPAASNPHLLVPRIAADGTTPMRAYAAASPAIRGLAPNAPKIAVMVAGLGYNTSQDEAAASQLPPAISFAISPFGAYLAQAQTAARAGGHEMILMLPMQALLAHAPMPQNQALLDWSLARIQGYAGVTDCIGPALGGGFMQSAGAKNWLLSHIAQKGLFFVEGDPSAGAPPFAWSQNATLLIDPLNHPQDETGQLAALLASATAAGHASTPAQLAILLNPTPQAVSELAAWLQSLAQNGVRLVPVSQLATPPDMAAP